MQVKQHTQTAPYLNAWWAQTEPSTLRLAEDVACGVQMWLFTPYDKREAFRDMLMRHTLDTGTSREMSLHDAFKAFFLLERKKHPHISGLPLIRKIVVTWNRLQLPKDKLAPFWKWGSTYGVHTVPGIEKFFGIDLGAEGVHQVWYSEYMSYEMMKIVLQDTDHLDLIMNVLWLSDGKFSFSYRNNGAQWLALDIRWGEIEEKVIQDISQLGNVSLLPDTERLKIVFRLQDTETIFDLSRVVPYHRHWGIRELFALRDALYEVGNSWRSQQNDLFSTETEFRPRI